MPCRRIRPRRRNGERQALIYSWSRAWSYDLVAASQSEAGCAFRKGMSSLVQRRNVRRPNVMEFR
jgi:hypothetical protein